MGSQTTRFKICDHRGKVIAVHCRKDFSDGTKKVWWETPEGGIGLPEGVGVTDLPLFGSELARTIPVTKAMVITEGEKAALALRAGGIPALATVTGAATVPTPKALIGVAYVNKFILWPDNDKAGKDHMKALARNLFIAGAREIHILNYDPATEDARWPKGYDAADVVIPETAKSILKWMLDDWGTKARRPSARESQGAKADPLDTVIVVRSQRDDGSVSLALRDVFGMDATPGKSARCPMHDDRAASLSVLRDDLRAICHAPCEWGAPGVTASDIRKLSKEPVQ